MTSLWYQFQAGGWAMWLILGWLLATMAIIVERIVYLFSAYQDPRIFEATLCKLILAGDWARAQRVAKLATSPLGNITHAGLLRLHRGARGFQEGMDEAALAEVPRISQRVGYLALFANLAMLSGLLGTIVGLIKAFAAVGGESVDASQKARLLAEGISEAMNCTAFGLLTAITALVGHACLTAWVQEIESDLHKSTVEIYNAVVSRLGP